MKPPSWPARLAASTALGEPPRPSWRTSTQERRRDDLLDAAEQLLAEKGLLAASLQEIGQAIGLAPYAVRAQFGNREMIVEAVLDRHLDRLIDRLRVWQAHTEAPDPINRLYHAIIQWLEMLSAYRNAQRVFVAAMSGASPHLVRTLKLRQRHLVHFFAGLIADAAPEAEGRTELAMPAALSLMGMAAWHVLWFRDRGALSRDDYARLLTHMVIEGVITAAAHGIGCWEEQAAPDGG